MATRGSDPLYDPAAPEIIPVLAHFDGTTPVDVTIMEKGAGSSVYSTRNASPSRGGGPGTASNRGLGPGTRSSSNSPTINLGEGPSDPTKPTSPFTEVGSSGLAQYGGFVRDEFLPQLQGDRGLKVWREMYDNDPIIGSMVFAIQMLLRKVEWRVEPPEAGSVEDIVAEREADKLKAKQLTAQAQAQQTMMAQAGLASNSAATLKTGMGPDGKPPQPGMGAGGPGQPPRASMASPAHATPPMHQGVTPPNLPGPNPSNNITRPGTNAPLTPDAPGTNPGGGPAQDAAVQGKDGLPVTGNPKKRQKTNPSEEIQNSRDSRLVRWFQKAGPPDEQRDAGGKWCSNCGKKQVGYSGDRVATAKKNHGGTGAWAASVCGDCFNALEYPDHYNLDGTRRDEGMTKASAGGGGTAGGIGYNDPGVNGGIDPESELPMEYAIGMGPDDPMTPEERKAQELAVFVETCLHDTDTPWADLISQIITMIVYGFAYHELVYKKRNGPNPDFPEQGSRFSDGKIGWAKIAGRAQETRHRWEFDENGNVLGMWQLAPPHFVLKYIPMQKALLFRTTAYKGNPEGRSLIRSAYRPWFFKRRIEEIEAIGVERDLAGLPIAYVPYQMMTPGATAEEQATLVEIKKLVRNIRRDEQDGVVFPRAIDPESKEQLYELTLLGQGAGRRQFDTNAIITRYEQRMAMVVLADFIMFGHEDTGARSLGETKQDMFTTALEALLNAIADVFNTYAIPRLMQINGEDPARSPKLTFGSMARISLDELAAFVTALSGAGAMLFPDTQLEDFLREAAGMPPKSASDDL